MAKKRGPGRPKGSVNKPLKRLEISPIVAYYPLERKILIEFLSFDSAIKLAKFIEENI